MVGVVFAVVVLTVVGIVLAARSGDPRWLFLSLPFTLILFLAGRYAPSGYRLAADGIHVERRGGAKVIPYGVILGVDRAPRRAGGLSMFAVKGIFGTFGRFWNTQLGFYEIYASDREALVWLATRDGWIALSPDRPDEFVDRLRERLTPR